MIQFLDKQLKEFKTCFSRNAAYKWFVIIVLGLMTRTDQLGVTSIIRALSLDGCHYEKLLHFFQSTAYSKSNLKMAWLKILKSSGLLQKHGDRILLFGDGTKVSKEARFMPGVKKLYRESENLSKSRLHLWPFFRRPWCTCRK